jgi:sugar lactone lactonase YvrE
MSLPAHVSTAEEASAQERAALELMARQVIERNARRAYPAPDFGKGKAWLNTARPLSLKEDLAGKVVLIDFWTYCCINCIHVLPDLEHLEHKYAADPFVVVGCHSAKFTNEAEAANVRQAVLRYDIAHPVVVDQDFEIWKSFGINSWPSFALIGPEGSVLAVLSGEGQRDTLAALIGQALAFYGGKAEALSRKPLALRRESLKELAKDLSFPGKVAVDPVGKHLYISDSNHDRILVTRLDGAFVRAFGSGLRGFRDGPANEARFHKPQGVAFHRETLLVADTENHALRRVDLATGEVSTLSGDGQQGRERRGEFTAREVALNSPWDLLVRGDDVFIAMAGPHQIWKLDLAQGKIGVFAGDGSERKADGTLERSAFAQPSGLAAKGNTLYIADSESSSVRAIALETGAVSTVAGGDDEPRDLFHFGDEDGKGLGRRFQHPLGVLVHEGVLYVADTYNHKVKTLDVETGEARTFAGTGKPGFSDGPAAEASFHEPGGLAAAEGKLYVADTNNHAIRVIDLKSRQVSTLILAGVPLVMERAVASGKESVGEEPLPELAGTARPAPVRVQLAVGEATLRLRVELPPGEKLAEGAPSQFRVIPLDGGVKPRARGGAITGTETLVPLEVGGPGRLLVQALYYHCAGSATCSVRSVRWEAAVETGPDGAREAVLTDRLPRR